MLTVAIGMVQPLVLDALTRAVGTAQHMTVVGRALALATLVELAEVTQADVVLADPDLCAAGVLGLIDAFALAPARLLLLGGDDQIDGLAAGLGKGIGGALGRTATRAQVIEAVRAVAAGETFVAPGLQQRFVERMLVLEAAPVAVGLTAREREVLRLTAQGCTAVQVAQRMFLSIATVKTHLRAVYRKLNVQNAAGAVAVGLREGLVPMPQPGDDGCDRAGRIIHSDERNRADRTIVRGR